MNPFANDIINKLPQAKLTQFTKYRPDDDKSIRTVKGFAFCVAESYDFLGYNLLEFAEVYKIK